MIIAKREYHATILLSVAAGASMKRLPILTIKQVRVISAVATYASLARASEQLNTSQSSLSRCIAEVESSLHQRLFERGWSGMEPTSQGELVIAHFGPDIAVGKINTENDDEEPKQKQSSLGTRRLRHLSGFLSRKGYPACREHRLGDTPLRKTKLLFIPSNVPA